MNKKTLFLIIGIICFSVSFCKAQMRPITRSSSSTPSTPSTYFGSTFKTISSYNIGGNTIALEKKLNMSDYRTNGDGSKFYKTTLAVSMITKSKTERTIIDTDVYTDANYSKGALPCMMIDPQKRMLFIFANSKGPDHNYGMDGYVYKIDMQTQRWSRETVFTRANYGWFSFFGGSNEGNPELWHFSFAGYRVIKSLRYSDGTWRNFDVGGIRPDQADAQYGYHKNILVTSSSGVDKMTPNYTQNDVSSSNSIVPGISDRTLVQGAAIVGAGALIYGLFNWLGSAISSSSSSSSYSSSYSSSSSNRAETAFDVETVKLSDFSYTVDNEWVSSVGDDILQYQRKTVYFKDKDGQFEGQIFREYNNPNSAIWPHRGADFYYDSWENLIISLYTYKKYGQYRKTGRKKYIWD